MRTLTIVNFAMITLVAVYLLIYLAFGWEKTQAEGTVAKPEFAFNEGVENMSTNIKWGRYNQAVTAYKPQIEEMVARGYSLTRILDLLALKSMECNRYDGACMGLNAADVGPFQSNQIHKEVYGVSLSLLEQGRWEELFLYQLTFADGLIESYDERFCGEHIFSLIGREFSNERHFKCVAVSYNGSPRYKATYAALGWEKRKMIKAWLVNNSNILN